MHIFKDPLQTPLNITVEEDQGPEVISTIDMQDSLHQYKGITNIQAGQIHTLILKVLGLTSLGTVTGIGIICIPHLEINICITKAVILIKIIVTYIITQMICTP